MGKFGHLGAARVESAKTGGLTREDYPNFLFAGKKGMISEPTAKKMAPIARATRLVAIHQPACVRWQ
jgi:hypothetical protein